MANIEMEATDPWAAFWDALVTQAEAEVERRLKADSP